MTFHNQDKARKRNILVTQGSRKQVGIHYLSSGFKAPWRTSAAFSQPAAAWSNLHKLRGHWGIKPTSRHLQWGHLKTFTAFSKLSCTDLSVCGRGNLCVCQELLWEPMFKKKNKTNKKPPQLNHNSIQEQAARNRPPASTNAHFAWLLSFFPRHLQRILQKQRQFHVFKHPRSFQNQWI